MAEQSAVVGTVPAEVGGGNVAPAGGQLSGNSISTYFQLFNDEPAIPQANELLSLKILKDANPDAFASIAADETKWLAVAFGLLKRDPYLQVQLKGRGVRQAMKLANLLKQKAEERHFIGRIDGVVNRMVDARFKEGGWDGLRGLDNDGLNEFLVENKDSEGDTIMRIDPYGKAKLVYGDGKPKKQ